MGLVTSSLDEELLGDKSTTGEQTIDSSDQSVTVNETLNYYPMVSMLLIVETKIRFFIIFPMI